MFGIRSASVATLMLAGTNAHKLVTSDGLRGNDGEYRATQHGIVLEEGSHTGPEGVRIHDVQDGVVLYNDVARPFPDGANCLFIGNSFFVHVAEDFDQLAQVNGFPKHVYQNVFRGGQNGAPQALWNVESDREEIDGMLSTGRVDLFGLTTGRDVTVADYQNWIDLALEYNSETAFFVGQPWVTYPGQKTAAAYDVECEEISAMAFSGIVVELRRLYPENQIFYLGYGKTASVMKERFEAGTLPDITAKKGEPGTEFLFADGFGHGGPMVKEMAALTWIDFFYAALPTIHPLTLLGDWDMDSVADITTQDVEYNKQFEATSTPPVKLEITRGMTA